MHEKNTKNATASNSLEQTFLTNMPSTTRSSPNSYFNDLAIAFIKARFHLSRIENEAMRSFVEKYTGRATPSESTSKTIYMREESTENMNSMKQGPIDFFKSLWMKLKKKRFRGRGSTATALLHLRISGEYRRQ